MTKADLGVAILLFLVTAINAFFFWRKVLRKEKLKALRYPLFGVRHEMVKLVADGVISEDDEVFQFLYVGVNAVIPRAKAMSLREFVSMLNESEVGRRLEEIEFRDRFFQAVNNEDKRVRAVARSFFTEFGNILFARSELIRISAVLSHRTISWLRTAVIHLAYPFKAERTAMRMYETVRCLEEQAA